MKASPEEAIRQIQQGEAVVFREAWYHWIAFLAISVLAVVGGYFAVREGYAIGWLFLIGGGLMLIFIPLVLLFVRAEIRLDRNGITIRPEDVQHDWSNIEGFFVSTGDSGEQWVAFRKLGESAEPDNAAEIGEISSSFGFRPQALADFLNEIHARLTGQEADN